MPPQSNNQHPPIGVVTYRLDQSSGELEANWAFSAQNGVEVVCKGIAVLNTASSKASQFDFVANTALPITILMIRLMILGIWRLIKRETSTPSFGLS